MTAAGLGKDSDDPGSAFDLLVDPLQRVGRPDLLPVRFRERGERQHFGLGVVHQRADLRERLGRLIADLIPGFVDSVGVGLGENGAEHRRGHVHVRLGDMSEQVAGEVDPAALMPGALKTPTKGFDQASVLVGEMTSRTPDRPRLLRLVRKPHQNVSSSESPTLVPGPTAT